MGFLLYHALPVYFVQHISQPLQEPAPIPFQKQCAYALNVKTVFNSPLGNPKKLQRLLKYKGLDLTYLEEPTYGYMDIPPYLWFSYLLFEYIPLRLLGKEPSDPYSLLSMRRCLPLSSDMPIVLSLWSLDLPGYGFILGRRKNLQYSDSCEKPKADKLVPYVGSSRVDIYAYSSKGFYFAGDSFQAPASLVFNSFDKKVLIFLFKDGKVYRVFDQNLVGVELQGGSYSVLAYRYRFKLWKFYFGMRSLLCTPAFHAM